MPDKYLDLTGLQKFKENISAVATQTKDGFMSANDKVLLDNTIGENLLPYPYYNTTHSDNVITFTDIGDGTINVSDGTATGVCYFVFRSYGATEKAPLILPKGTYTISGGTAEIYLEVYTVVNNAMGALLARDKGKGYTFTIEEDTQIMCRIFIAQDTTIPATTIEPMLVTSSIKRPFQRYDLSRIKLRDDIDSNITDLETHAENNDIHITSDERTTWTNKAEHEEIIGENIIPYPYAQTTRIEYGIEWVDLGNGTILAKAGTATEDSIFNCRVRGDDVIIDPNPLILPAGTYSVSGCPSGGTSTSYRILLVGKTSEGTYGAILGEYGKGAKLTLTEESQIQVQLVIAKGTTIPDLYFTPMIEKGSGVHSYQPYSLSRPKLRADIDALNTVATSSANGLMSSTDKKRLDNEVANRNEIVADNLLIYPYLNTTHSDNVITFTDNGDGTIGISAGTPTGACYFFFRSFGATEKTPLILPSGTYTISGGTSSIYIEVYSVVDNAQGTLLARDRGNGYTFTLTEDTQIICRITIAQDTDVSATIIKPMLEKGSVSHPYTEYSKSRDKLREDVNKALTSADVVDNVTSTSTTLPLSANQGNVLNTRVNSLQPHPYSLARSTDIGELSTTQATYSTFNNRKFSDYGMILITIGASTTDVRASLMIPRIVFDGNDAVSGKTFYLDCWTNNGQTFNQVAVKWNSDIAFTAYLTTAGTVTKHLNIYGIKVDDVAL